MKTINLATLVIVMLIITFGCSNIKSNTLSVRDQELKTLLDAKASTITFEEHDVFHLILSSIPDDSDRDLLETKFKRQASILNLSKTDCLRFDGHWGTQGFSQPSCNLPTSDGGKLCQRSVDCESLCIIPDEYIDGSDGICYEWSSNFGCHNTLNNLGDPAYFCSD